MNTIFQVTFCGRRFTAQEVELMRMAAHDYAGLGVTEIARTICELLEWKRPNGGLKNHECRQLLEGLQAEGVLTLPALRHSGGSPLEKTHFCHGLLGLAILLLCTFSAFSQQTQRQTALREILPGHYVFSSGTFNSGLIVTSEGVVVLDALNSENVGKAEREAIANTIRQPVRFLVSSTFHNNYSKGNVAYADVWKIGHENYRLIFFN